MTSVYFDSSALVKLVIDEEGSNVAAQLWDGCTVALSSRLAYPEVRAALGALHRNGAMSRSGLVQAEREWGEYWSAIRAVELTVDVEQQAGAFAVEHALRGADAVHLSSALAVGPGDLIVAVWDRRLSAGARAAGLRVAPDLPPDDSAE